MRRQFVVVVVAVVTLVALAFLIPLARLIDDFAEDRGVTLVQLEAENLARALTLVDASNPTVLATLVEVGDASVSRSLILGGDVTVGPPAGDLDALEAARTGEWVLVEELDGVAAYIPVVAAAEPVVVRAFVGPEVLDRNVRPAWFALFGLGVVLTGVGAIIADRLARSIVRPVEALADAAARLGEGELAVRVEPEGPEELRTVARVFNRLGGRLQQLLRLERESVADLSHRLRTPLTALQLEAEQLEPGAPATRMQDAVDAMQREIDHLITEARRPVRNGVGATADLKAVVAERAAFWEPLMTEQQRELIVALPGAEVPVAGHRRDLIAALDALIGNVVSHTDDGVTCWVTVSPGLPMAVVVEDDGPGFPGAEAAERGFSAAGSTGLGLDIVRRTAEAVGGEMELGHRPGGGARVRLVFGSD